MPTHCKPDLSVTALLQNLNDELDRKKTKKVEDLMLAKMQSSVHGRLGPRINKQHAQISHCQGCSNFCGAIFMCNKRTWKECLRQSLFGLPIGKKGLVEQVIPGMKLFLFEFERRQLWGVFEAASYGGMDIIPNAYTGGSFPCQVRVKVPEDCVALYEGEFCEAIMDNYYAPGKFHFDLTEKQVCRLTSLFERKYLSFDVLHSNLLEYDDERYILDGCKPSGGLRLLSTNDAASLYPDESLKNSWYSSSCQVTNGPLLFEPEEEDIDYPYKKSESRTRRKNSEKGSLIPLSNGAVDIIQNNVASLTGESGKGFHSVSASCRMFYGINNHSVVEDVSAGGLSLMSRLHSDRPVAKSVWARISGRPVAALESLQAKKSPEASPVMSPPKICTILEMDVEDETLIQDQEFCRGFKRRRANNNKPSDNVDGTPSKRRRKLTRPSFEDAHDVSQPNIDLNLPLDASLQNDQEVAIVLDKSPVLKDEERRATDATVRQVSGSSGAESLTTLEQLVEPFNERGGNPLVCEMQQEQCCLALSLATQENVLHSREGINDRNPAASIFHQQPEALVSVEHAGQDEVEKPHIFIGQSEQGGRAGGGVSETVFLGKEEQGSDLQPHDIFFATESLDLAAADSLRTRNFSLAPCTPAKEFSGSSNSIEKEDCDERKSLSHNLAQDIPLTLELGNGAQLPDAKLHLHDIIHPEHALGNSCKRQDGDNASYKRDVGNYAVVRDESFDGSQGRESQTISMECTAGGNLLNQDQIKSFLSGLQVSGIKLQLGASPCLILQLGDSAGSTSNLHSEDPGGATPGQSEPS